MPTSIAFAAAQGAIASKGSGLELFGKLLPSSLQGALLFGGLAAARYVFRPKFDSPSIQASQTVNTIRVASAPARWIVGRSRVSGVVVHAHENLEEVTGIIRPDGQRKIRIKDDGSTTRAEDNDVGKHQYFSYVMYLAEHPIEEVERIWINGVEQVDFQYGNLFTGPNDTLRPVENPPDDDDLRIRPILPPRGGKWGIGLGNGDGNWTGQDAEGKGVEERLSGTTRNLEPERYPWIIWPRITGAGKPPYAGPRSGGQWWDRARRSESRGVDGHSYLVIDLYQNTRLDERNDRKGYNWSQTIPDIQVQVKGLRIRVPVNVGTAAAPVWEESEPEWTENAASVAWWFHRNRLGAPGARGIQPDDAALPGLPMQALDVARWREEIDYCNERIADEGIEGDETREPDPTRTIIRYAADGVIQSGDPVPEVLRELAQCMDGAITTSSGRISVAAGRPRDAEHDVPASDVVELVSVEVQPPTNERANAARMRLRQSALHDWLPHEQAVVWNEAGERNDGIRLEVDTGERAFMVSPVRANLMMNAELLRIRIAGGLQMAPVYTFTILPGQDDRHYEVRELDRITISFEPLALTRMEAEVLSIRANPDMTLTMVLRANGSVSTGLTPVLCPGYGGTPPAYPRGADALVAILYAAPSTLMPTIITPDPPPALAPVATLVEVVQDAARFTLDRVEGASSYEYRIGAAGDWVRTSRNVRIEGLTPNTAYAIYFRARNRWGAGPTSAATAIMTLRAAPTGVPVYRLLSATMVSLTFTIDTPATDADGYEYQIAGFNLRNIQGVWHRFAGLQATVGGLEAGTDYRVRIRSYNAVGAGPAGPFLTFNTQREGGGR